MRMKLRAVIASLLITFALVSAAYAGNVNPVPVGKKDRCPVCGMFVAPYKAWVTEVVFRDGTYAVFDGAKDMFKYYFNMRRYDSARKRSDISGIFVTEYYSAKLMAAQGLFFVRGSNVFGPMGAELIPVASMEEARTFMHDHGGNKILRFKDVTMEMLP